MGSYWLGMAVCWCVRPSAGAEAVILWWSQQSAWEAGHSWRGAKPRSICHCAVTPRPVFLQTHTLLTVQNLFRKKTSTVLDKIFHPWRNCQLVLLGMQNVRGFSAYRENFQKAQCRLEVSGFLHICTVRWTTWAELLTCPWQIHCTYW